MKIEANQNFSALPGAWHLERCQAPKEWSDMTRRAFLSSKSNTGAREIQIKHADQKFQELGQKNEDCSKSVSSFDSGAIFRPSLGEDLSRNGFVVFIYAF